MLEWLKSISLNQWLVCLAIVLSVIILCLGLLSFFLRKAGKQDAAERVSKTIKFAQVIRDLVLTAETHSHWSGSEKKDYVISKAQAEFAKLGFDYTDDEVSQQIELFMEVGNKINGRGTYSNKQ